MEKRPEARELPAQQPRVETGNVRFGGDWTGVFIRGDNAGYWASQLRFLLQNPSSAFAQKAVEALLQLLENSNENK